MAGLTDETKARLRMVGAVILIGAAMVFVGLATFPEWAALVAAIL